MKKIITTFFLFISVGIIQAQEFPIATGSDTTWGMGASFDGTNYLVPIMGDNQSKSNVTAQFISSSGSLIGSRILIGANCASRGVPAAYDGTNYFIVWLSSNGNVVGQFLSPSGNLIGSAITISTNASIDNPTTILAYNSGTYFVCYIKDVDLVHHRGFAWGQRVSTSGNLLGSEFQVTANYVKDASMAFDGTNYLIAYTDHTGSFNNLYARFFSPTGSLVGNEITVATGNYWRDNPTSLAFDGSRYLLSYHEQAANAHQWFIYGRFIDTLGTLQNLITICDSSLHPNIAMVTYGNNNYLTTWFQEINGSMMGQWYSPSGSTVGASFVIFNTLNNKFPIGACIYGDTQFLSIATRLNTDWTDGDVYGKFLSTPAGITDISNGEKISLYPNPATDIVTLTIANLNIQCVTLNIYNIMGSLVKSEIIKQNQQQINVNDLNNGMYVVEIKSNDFTEKQKLLIQK